MSHSADYAWGHIFAVLADYQKNLIPKDVMSKLAKFEGEHTFVSSAYYPLSTSAESYDEISLGGPGQNQAAFNPAVVQWDTGHEVAFISLYPTEPGLQAEVSPNTLTLTYPRGNAGSKFSLSVGTFVAKRTVNSWAYVQGLNVNVTGNVDLSATA